MNPDKMKYMETHPWLTFDLGLWRFTSKHWLLLGQIQSLLYMVLDSALKPSIRKKLRTRYLAKGALASAQIEGNTLSEEDAQQAIEKNLEVPESKGYLKQELENILEVLSLIEREMLESPGHKLSVNHLKAFNEKILEKLTLPDKAKPGRIRNFSIGVGRYKAPPAEDCNFLLGQLCQSINRFGNESDLDEFSLGTLIGIYAHLVFVLIHPFGDGNGRTARALEFWVLIAHEIPFLSAHLLSNHYNETRTAYYLELDRVSQTNGDLSGFFLYALIGLRDQLIAQVKVIISQNLEVSWENFLHETLAGESVTIKRQRDLVLWLTKVQQPISVREMKSQFSYKLAKHYAKISDKTFDRDLKKLAGRLLLVKTQDKYSANMELMTKFKPLSVAIQSNLLN